MGLSFGYGPATDKQEAISLIRAAVEGGVTLLALVRDWARRKGATPAQFSLAWLLAQKPWIVPIPGTTNPQHLAENLGAVEVKFTPDELREIRAAVSKIKVQGARPPGSLPDDARSSRMS